MNLGALDLNLLAPLDALLEEASVTRAAARVGLSQPAMSHALKRLRTLLGDPLLVRSAGRMQRTRRAEALRAPLRDALVRVRDLLSPEGFDPATSRRTFRLQVADNACDVLLPPLLDHLSRAGPGIRIALRPLAAGDDAFAAAQSVDVAVACVPGLPRLLSAAALQRPRRVLPPGKRSRRPDTSRWRRWAVRTPWTAGSAARGRFGTSC
jgi:DNA-binding transcriptional LysR family regulator